jgi:hypothetical protein
MGMLAPQKRETSDVAVRHDLQRIERLALELIDINARLADQGHPQLQLFNIRGRADGLKQWRIFLRSEYRLDW